jgi:hypothetical protein
MAANEPPSHCALNKGGQGMLHENVSRRAAWTQVRPAAEREQHGLATIPTELPGIGEHFLSGSTPYEAGHQVVPSGLSGISSTA